MMHNPEKGMTMYDYFTYEKDMDEGKLRQVIGTISMRMHFGTYENEQEIKRAIEIGDAGVFFDKQVSMWLNKCSESEVSDYVFGYLLDYNRPSYDLSLAEIIYCQREILRLTKDFCDSLSEEEKSIWMEV